jgi:hypothetical protein
MTEDKRFWEDREVADLAEFFTLSSGGMRRAMHVQAREWIDDPVALLRGLQVPEVPIVFEYHSGGAERDMIGSTDGYAMLVSSRLISIFRENAFTGWDTYRASVYGKAGREIPGYRGLVVNGRCGDIDYSQCGPEWRSVPVPRPGFEEQKVWIGLHFELSSWDGTDIFMPESSQHIFVTERVVRVSQQEKLENLTFTPLTEVELLSRPGYPMEGEFRDAPK